MASRPESEQQGGALKARLRAPRLLAGANPCLMVTDPPYGVNYQPAFRHQAYPRQRTAVGRVTNDTQADWAAAYALFPGDIAYVWHAALFADVVMAGLRQAEFEVRSQIVWAKPTFVLGRGAYHWQHEPAWYAVRQGRGAPWYGGRAQSTVWEVPNLNAIGGSRTGANTPTGHATQKPVRASGARRFCSRCSRPPTPSCLKLTSSSWVALGNSPGPTPRACCSTRSTRWELRILEAAQGQPMDRDGVRAQTVMSSTHQHPDGTVTAMRRRAADLGWPVYEWCYRETLAPHGWLTEDQVTRKRGELSRTMWAVEYELQEPSAEGRAIDPAAVERMFDATLGTHIPAGDLAHTWRGQPGPPADRAWPDPAGAWYCIGIDWAQKRHYTVAVVVRCDTTPLQVVAVYRIRRRPWPEMTERVGALLDEFPGPATHDATGAGSAIGEFPALAAHDQLQGVTLVGCVRTDLFRNYIGAIERHEIVCPRIDVFYTEHLYCGEDDLFGSEHPPDTVVAMALAYHAFKTGRQPGDYGVTL